MTSRCGRSSHEATRRRTQATVVVVVVVVVGVGVVGSRTPVETASLATCRSYDGSDRDLGRIVMAQWYVEWHVVVAASSLMIGLR